MSCAETSYTSVEGLEFTLYCKQDATGLGDINNTGADSPEKCMDLCSQHPLSLCGAAAFDSNESRCYFKNTNITARSSNDRDNFVLGVAKAAQLAPYESKCDNVQNQTAKNGLDFMVYCNQIVVGYDSCTDEAPGCRTHTSSVEECLDYCSTMHPLCTGVAWDSTVKMGYLNCYPKNTTADMLTKQRSQKKGWQAAKALLQVATDDCRSNGNGTVVANNGVGFELACNEDRFGSDIQVSHVGSYGGCIESCANYTGGQCVGAVHDGYMVNGYENCYLKSSIGVATPDQQGFTFALRQGGSNNSTSNSTSASQQGDKGNGSKAWIAGPVVGGIVVIAIILGLLWWQRKRTREKAPTTQAVAEHETWPSQQLHVKATNVELDSDRPAAELETPRNAYSQ